MASRHFSFKIGKLGAGAKHAEYIAGVGKYARDDVCHLSDHNLPEWAKDGCDFFAAADANERANGRSYSEIEFAIPREAADPVAYALQYAEGLLGNRHVYRLAVHDKPASDGGRNIHGHLQFSERRLDGIERDRDQFFRRANTKHPERGGAPKDRLWNDRQHIDRLRRGYEAHAKAHGITLNLRSNDAQGLGPAEEKIGPHKRRSDPWRESRLKQAQGIRQRRNKTLTEIQETKRELREARRERARRDTSTCRNVAQGKQQPYSSAPLAAMLAEHRAGRTVFRWAHGAAEGRAAIIDRGNLISLAGKTSQPKVQAMIALAKAKGWKSIRLTGNDEFKHLAIRQALSEGLTVSNPELAVIVSQLQKESSNHGTPSRKTTQQHGIGSGGKADGPRRAFEAWRATDCEGLRVSRRVGPQRMPTLRHVRSGNGQPETCHVVLQHALSGHRDRDNVLYGVHAEHAESWPLGVNPMDHTTHARRVRIELAQHWLAVAAPLDALEAAKLRADQDRLLQVFEELPEARHWERVERQRAQGVPEPLLGFEIDPSEPAGPFQGTVRHVGKRTWIEPRHRPGVVFPINAQPLRPGQQIKRLPDGRVEVLQSDSSPQPR